jgi:hypothetical protein
MKNLEFTIPKGYVIDTASSTDEKLVYIKKEEKITDRIKTFKDAYEHLNIINYRDAYKILGLKRRLFCNSPIEDCDDEALKLMIIVCALNEGWTPDWLKTSEKKWYPYFKYVSSGFGFSDSDFLFRLRFYVCRFSPLF